MFKTYLTSDEKINEFVKKYTNIEEDDEEYFDDYFQEMIYGINNFIESNESVKGFEINGKVVAIFKIVKSLSCDYYKKDEIVTNNFDGIICGFYYDHEKENFLMEKLSYEYPNHLLIYDDNMRYESINNNYKMLELKLDSSFERNYEEEQMFYFQGQYLVSLNTTIEIDLIKEIINNYYKNIAFDSYEVQSFNYENEEDVVKLKTLFENEVIVSLSGSDNKFYGFHYATPKDLFGYRFENPKGLKFYVVIGVKDNIMKPLSVLKTAYYSLNDTKDYLGINYINTNSFFKKKGLSKLLYQKLNEDIESLPYDILLISSGLSNQGEKANIDKTRLKYVTASNCNQFNSTSDYRDYIYKNI